MIGELLMRSRYRFIKQYNRSHMPVSPELAVDGIYVMDTSIDHGYLSNIDRARPWLAEPYESYFCILGRHCHTLDGERCPSGRCRPFDSYWDGYSASMLTGKTNGLIVIDIDPRNLPQNPHRLDKGRELSERECNEILHKWKIWVEDAHGKLPTTWTVRTGRFGVHLYYRWNGTFTSKSIPTMQGVDFLGDGKKVLVPPFNSGKGDYFWVHPPYAESLADLPPWVFLLHTQWSDDRRVARPLRADWGGDDEKGRVVAALAHIPYMEAYGDQGKLFCALGYAACSSGHEDAFIEWSQSDPDESKWATPAQLRNFRKNGLRNLGSLFWIAGQHGYKGK